MKYTALFGYQAQISAIAVDAAGNAYIAGTANSALPTTAGAFQSAYKPATCISSVPNSFTQTPYPCPVAFAGKLNHEGTALMYLTYLGASNSSAYGIAVDAAGNAWITGTVSSTDLPVTPGAPQTNLKGKENGFVLKLNASGSGVLFGTYLDGGAASPAIDGAGNAFVAGTTTATDFPVTAGAFQTEAGGDDVGPNSSFVMKYNPGGHLLYSTYFHGGNPSATYISAIAVDSAGNAYVTGSHTGGSLLTTPGAFETSPNPKYEVSRALPGEY